MADYQLSHLADRDIQEIAASTLLSWGAAQARAYIENLHKVLLMLADNPSLGKARDELFSDAKSFPAGRHTIFYRACSGGIEVARILHQHRDYLSLFAE